VTAEIAAPIAPTRASLVLASAFRKIETRLFIYVYEAGLRRGERDIRTPVGGGSRRRRGKGGGSDRVAYPLQSPVNGH
jgi:hypothetical protein